MARPRSRPRPGSAVAVVARQLRWEQKQYWRNPAAAAFTFAFPLMFLIIFVAINGNGTVSIAGGRVRFAQYYVPAILAFGLISACYTNLAFSMSVNRENGILKRVRGTPLSPSAYLAGVVSNVIVIGLILTALTTALGLLFYRVTFPDRYLGLAVAVAAAAFCFSALGIAVSTFVPNEDAAPAIINFLLFPLLFISGTFGAVKDSSALAKIANFFPIRHLILLLVDVFNPRISGSGIGLSNLGVLLIWGVIGIAVALRRFRWEPRHS
jgi:ABC-2 type transport system permease protein